MSKNYRTCPTCTEYARERMPVVVPHLAVRSHKTGETSEQILDRFMGGVHDRHLSGLPILPDGAQ